MRKLTLLLFICATFVSVYSGKRARSQIARLRARLRKQEPFIDALRDAGFDPAAMAKRKLARERARNAGPRDPPTRREMLEAMKTPEQELCALLTCNFEAKTMCNYVSLGKIATYGRMTDAAREAKEKAEAAARVASLKESGSPQSLLKSWTSGGGGGVFADLLGGFTKGDLFGSLLSGMNKAQQKLFDNEVQLANMMNSDANMPPCIPAYGSGRPTAGGNTGGLSGFFKGSGTATTPCKGRAKQIEEEEEKKGFLEGLFDTSIITDITEEFVGTGLAWYTFRGKLGKNPFRIRQAAQKGFFAGAYLLTDEKAVMTALLGNATRDVRDKFRSVDKKFKGFTLTFWAYEAGYNVQLRVCCDSPDFCPYKSKYGATKDDFEWKEVKAKCPRGTTAVVFVCENFGKSEAACGIDDVKIEEKEFQCRQEYVPPDLNPNNAFVLAMDLFDDTPEDEDEYDY